MTNKLSKEDRLAADQQPPLRRSPDGAWRWEDSDHGYTQRGDAVHARAQQIAGATQYPGSSRLAHLKRYLSKRYELDGSPSRPKSLRLAVPRASQL